MDYKFSDPIIIAIVVRDRLSMFKSCLEAVYLHTELPFRIIAVVGRADKQTQSFLKQFEKQKNNFEVIFIDRLLMQGESRNIALNHSDERFCVILENDTIVHENWLSPLLDCMTTEKAAVVVPLIYWHRGIHATGGKFVEYKKDGKVMFKNEIHYSGITRKQIDYPENHCLLIDRKQFPIKEIFDDVEPFDVDLGLICRKYGLSIYFEPRSVVTYSAPPLWEVRDIDCFKFRWNASLWKKRNRLFMQKWDLLYDPSHKIASYQRQQIKIGFARWFPNKFALEISNKSVKFADYLHSLFAKFANKKTHE